MTETTLPPRAPKKFGLRVRNIHGDHFDDGWDWLRNEDNAEVLAHLDAENAWADEICAPTAGLAKRIAAEVKGMLRLMTCPCPCAKAISGTFTGGVKERPTRPTTA